MHMSVVAQRNPAREARILEVNGPPAVAVDDHSGCLFNKEAAAGVDYQREVKGRHAAGAIEGVLSSGVLDQLDISPRSAQAFDLFTTRANRRIVVGSAMKNPNRPVAHLLIIDERRVPVAPPWHPSGIAVRSASHCRIVGERFLLY